MTGTTELSEREIEILCLVATGASNKEIAQKLYISTNTVKVHLRNIFAKIEVASRTEAAMYAVNNRLVPAAAGIVLEGEPGAVEADFPASIPGALPEPGLPVSVALPAPVASWTERYGPPGALAVLILVLALSGALLLRRTDAPLLPGAVPAPTQPARWQALPPMPTARSSLALASVEDRIYAIGGETSSGVTALLEALDPATGSWTLLAPKPSPATDIAAGVIGGRVYVPGGRLASGKISDRLEIYDPIQDRWTLGAPLPAARSAYALAAYEGELYLFGGWDGQAYLDSVYRYNPNQDTWTQKTSLPSARGFAAAVVAAGRIYVIGGTDGRQALAENQVYTPDRDQAGGKPWVQAAPMPSGRYAMGAASIADIIHVLGGESLAANDPPALAYQPLSNKWDTFETPSQSAWSHLGLAAVGSRLYGIGGKLDQQPSAQSLSYQAIYTVSIPLIR